MSFNKSNRAVFSNRSATFLVTFSDAFSATFFLKRFYADKPLHIMIQMLEFLPMRIANALKNLNINLVYELRLRAGKPVRVNYAGRYRLLGEYGLTERKDGALKVTGEEIEQTVYRAGKFSVYAVEEQIRRGFITAEHGERIGLAGEYVFERGQVLAVRNFTSLCIRIPHEIAGSSKEIYEFCFSRGVKNTLIASSPGVGKTTILRDLAKRLSEAGAGNILICDERGEISALPCGDSCDVLLYADKTTAFEAGIRALRPDVMLTDELSARDCGAVERAISGGVKVIASAHFSEPNGVPPPFSELFDYYVFLNETSIGQIKGIYGKNLKEKLL